ncbi:MAG: 2-hydroxyacyl-CoA dehydratase, partial [Eggerthellaceae bacterium]|nr:2-hydroxyacyl-CoA dehydratase [Eggerthellaceae bacterium]
MAKKLHLTPGKRAHRHAPSRSHDHDTLLCPQMLPIHFELLKAVFDAHGRTLEIIDVPKRDALDAGLRYANNDLCYPAILVTGQIVAALKSGRYDLARTSVLMVQTGGACRATNYIAVIRRAIADAGLPRVPVVSLSAADLGEKNRFRLTPRMVGQAAAALAIGDVLMKCLYRTRPYE